jgi:hypothetical protein
MTVAATQANIALLKTSLSAYIAAITDTVAATETLLEQSATVALDNWASAKNAAANLAASAADSYSNGVGVSFTKRKADDMEALADGYMEEFIGICKLGSVEVPTLDNSGTALWDKSVRYA